MTQLNVQGNSLVPFPQMPNQTHSLLRAITSRKARKAIEDSAYLPTSQTKVRPHVKTWPDSTWPVVYALTFSVQSVRSLFHNTVKRLLKKFKNGGDFGRGNTFTISVVARPQTSFSICPFRRSWLTWLLPLIRNFENLKHQINSKVAHGVIESEKERFTEIPIAIIPGFDSIHDISSIYHVKLNET